jgi:serine/threonine protein phosphatase PrpC
MAGDVLLMCSDGLSHFVHDNVLRELLLASASPEGACEDLIQAAKAAGSNDNITCLVLRADEPSWSDRVLGRLKPGRSKSQQSI